jgi:septum formation protein
MRLILASKSPRREELLRNAGFEFEVRPSGVEEGQPIPGEMPEEFARRNARAKAFSVAVNLPAGNLVLGADTVVTIHGSILGKPRGLYDATRMLRLLSGQTHQVITGICLVRAPGNVEILKHEVTFVTFVELNDDDIRGYVATQEPYDKAGAYAIQGWASRWVTRISGCYFNVVGLPISLLGDMLKDLPKPTASGQDPPAA